MSLWQDIKSAAEDLRVLGNDTDAKHQNADQRWQCRELRFETLEKIHAIYIRLLLAEDE